MDNQEDVIKLLIDFDKRAGSLDISELVEQTIKYIADKFSLSRLSIELFQDAPCGLLIRNVTEEVDGLNTGQLIPLSNERFIALKSQLAPNYCPSLADHCSDSVTMKRLAAGGIKSFFTIPLVMKGAVLGYLNAGSRKLDGIPENDRDLLLLIAPRLAQAIHNSMLYEKLHESDSKFKSLVNSIDDLIFVLDSNHRITAYYADKDQLYLKPEEFLGKRVSEIMPPDVAAKLEDAINRLKTGGRVEFEYSLNMNNKVSWYSISLSSIFDNGTYQGVAAVARDITEKKEIEFNLKKSEEIYNTILEDSYAGIVQINMEMEICYVNDNIVKLFGYSKEELIGENFLKFLDDDTAALMKIRMEMRKAGELLPPFVEMPITRKDGAVRWIENRTSIINKVHGERVSMSQMLDITERKEAERELIETLQRQDLVLNAVPLAFYTADPNNDMATTWISEQVEGLIGFKAEVLTTSNTFWRSRIHPNDREQTLINYNSVLEKTNVTTEYRWQVSDGSYRWFQDKITLIKDRENKPLQVVGLWMDITERIESEESLRQSEERFRGMFENAGIGMYRTSVDGKVLMANPAIVRMLGYESFNQLEKLNLNDQANDQIASRKEFIQQMRERGYVTGQESVLTSKSGQKLYIRESAKAITNEHGDVLYFEGTLEDLTDRKRAEDELEEYRMHLEELVKARTSELEAKNLELERLNSLFVGREFRIKELREHVKELEQLMQIRNTKA